MPTVARDLSTMIDGYSVIDHRDATTALRTRGWTLPDGMTVTAATVRDCDARPEHFDCYDPITVTAWKADEWWFVELRVAVELDGHEIGHTIVGSYADGALPFEDLPTDARVHPNVLYDDAEVESLARDALAQAQAFLARAREITSAHLPPAGGRGELGLRDNTSTLNG